MSASDFLNRFDCTLYEETLNTTYLVSPSDQRIYRIAYLSPIGVKVRRYKIVSATQYNFRGIVEGGYTGDFLDNPEWNVWPEDKPKTIVSLDRKRGFYVSVFDSYGDFYGPCDMSFTNISNLGDAITAIGRELRQREEQATPFDAK